MPIKQNDNTSFGVVHGSICSDGISALSAVLCIGNGVFGERRPRNEYSSVFLVIVLQFGFIVEVADFPHVQKAFFADLDVPRTI